GSAQVLRGTTPGTDRFRHTRTPPRQRTAHAPLHPAHQTFRNNAGCMETYLIVIGKTATGYSAHCPDVPGCASVGKTVEEVVANMKKALKLHFEGMAEDGDSIPGSSGVKSYREVMKDLEPEKYFLAHVQIDTSGFATPASRS